MNLVFGGSTSIAERTFDLWALTQPPRDDTAPAPDTALTRIGLTGSWDLPRLTLDHVAPPSLPALVLPKDGKPKAVMSFTPGEE
jgi:hypothetical protein